MAHKRNSNTLYAQWVRGSVLKYRAEVKPWFTIKEFAEWAGCPITHNLRSRINDMVVDGELEFYNALLPHRGSVRVYGGFDIQ